MLFILSMNFTDQGIRGIKEAPKRAQAARDIAKKVGVEIRQVYLTSGESDLLVMIEAPDGDAMAKFCSGARHAGQCANPHVACLDHGRIPEAGVGAAVKPTTRKSN